MAEPIDHLVVRGIALLLRDISTDNGYRTNAGEHVLDEESRGDIPDGATVLEVLDDDEEANYQNAVRRQGYLLLKIAINQPAGSVVDEALRHKARLILADIRQALAKVDPLRWINLPTGRVSQLEIGGRSLFVREAGSSTYRPELRLRVTFHENHRSQT